jgi:L-asparaginase II
MLALARHQGWPVESYARLDHPVQQRCLAAVSNWTGVPVAAVGTAVDGCGVVCFALPLRSMALAYARLGNAELGIRNSELKDGSQFRTPHSAFPIVDAMLRHPELIAGEGRPCTAMMRAHPGRVVTKVGAGGVYCGLLTQEGWGIALKVEDGNGAAAALAMATVLAELGLKPQPDAVTEQQILNTRGVVVGELRVTGGLERGNDAAATAGAS